MSPIPEFARGLCDDAAVFPPGLAPLPDAVAAHARYRASAFADLVGPLVLPATALADLGPLLGGGEPLEISVTCPGGPEQLAGALATARDLPARVRAVEIAVPAGMAPAEFFAALQAPDADVYVEVPRDERRGEVIDGCARAGHRAKFRTGGVRAELYPSETELAGAIQAALDAGVPFKATAGLHHAIRNTDPETGFEQHGFLNLLLAVHAALGGEDPAKVLAERDAAAVAEQVRGLSESQAREVRARFVSFGTCSITEPLGELIDLGLIPAAVREGEPA